MSCRSTTVGPLFSVALMALLATGLPAAAQAVEDSDVTPVLLPGDEADSQAARLEDLLGQARRADTVPGDTDGIDDGFGTIEVVVDRPLADGDLQGPSETEQPLDGDLTADEAAAAVDGDLSADGRFLAPAAVIEPDGEPLAAQPAPAPTDPDVETDPYAAIGIRIGSFLLFPELSSAVIHADNVFQTSTDRKSDTIGEIIPAARLVSDWSKHSLEASVVARYSYHQEFATEDDSDLDARAKARIDVLRDTDIEFDAGFLRTQQSRGSADFPTGADARPTIETVTGAVTLDQRFNRLFARLRGEVAEQDEQGFGSTGDEDYRREAASARLGYELSPALSIFGEGARWRRAHAGPAGDGFFRDAEGQEFRIGVLLDDEPTWTGQASIGHAEETPDETSLASIDGIVFDAAVIWRPTALTTLTFTAAGDIEPTSQAFSGGALSWSHGVEIRHEFRRYLALLAGVGLTTKDNEGSSLAEDERTAHVGAEYLLSREWALAADWKNTSFGSTEPGASYEANEIRFGVRLRR